MKVSEIMTPDAGACTSERDLAPGHALQQPL
jgi:hypothetical protein